MTWINNNYPHKHLQLSTKHSWLLGQVTKNVLRGKTFAVVHKTHYSLESSCSASGQGHHVLYKANDSWGKLLQLAKKL